MYRTPIHEPRYKQRTRDRESREKARRHEDPRESSEGSTSDEDEESTDRYTEDSEDTTESQRGRQSFEMNAASSSFDRDRVFSRMRRPEEYLMRAYYANERVQKHDKITQKNFLSPFPSFLIPPIYREVAGEQNYGFATGSNPREDQDVLMYPGKPPRGSPRKVDEYEEKNSRTRNWNHDRKVCEKYKGQRDLKHSSRSCRPERVLTCMQGERSVDPSTILSRNAFEAEVFPRNSSKMDCGKKLKSASRESKPDESSGMCKDCLQSKENRKNMRRNVLGGDKEKENAMKEPPSDRMSPHGVPGNSGSGKVREKLVYVVEEEGKDVTKMETDLFSVNEILAIKKDLLELSEFAKKLKKLKEMQKDAQKGKASKTACQCKPVAELLKNVNKRIEALEARQEQLERGTHKTSQKGDTETESKKTTDPKTPPKTPVVRQQSAMTTVPSFPKTEMIVSRAGFSNNSEIVNELMDIKTQLQKLEKRRMSKDLTPEAAPLGESKITKKKDHSIAVFSSRTYILTTENYEKTKKQLPMKAEEKVEGYFPAAENHRSRTEQTKENVANWLKSVSPVGERNQNEIETFLEAKKLEEEINTGQPNCIPCVHVFNGDSFESQEPQKNRAPGVKPANQGAIDLDVLMKNASKTKRELMSYLTCKECVVTPSGRLFVERSSDEFARDLVSGWKAASKGLPPSHPVLVRRSASSCSVSSPIMTKERNGRLKKVFPDSPKPIASHSKSTQELSGTSSGCKDQKTVRNTNVKDRTLPPPRDKIHKENKNEVVKRRESNLIALKNFGGGDDPLCSSSFSELIRTVNLESGKASNSSDRQEESVGNKMNVYSLATMPKFNFKGFETRGKDEGIIKVRAKERRKKEEEATMEAAKKEQNRRPDFSKRSQQYSYQVVDVGEKVKNQKSEEEVCECVCCCKKKLKTHSNEGKVSGNETCSTTDLSERPRVRRSRERRERRERRKCRSSSDKVRIKRSRERRRRERRKGRLSRTPSRESVKKRRSRDREKRKRIRECLRKLRSVEKLKRRKSKECSKPKKKLSKSRIYCSHNRLSCKCQEKPESSSCGTDSLPSRSSSRQIDPPSDCIKPPESTDMKAPSENSIDVYLRRQRRKLEKQAQMEKEKLGDESCMFKNIFKNLRRLYPRFSNFQLGNFSGDINERKPSRQKQQPQRRMEYSEGESTGEEGYSERASYQSSNYDLKEGQQGHHGRHNGSVPYQYYDDSHYRHANQPEHLKNCKCVRVYLQTQGCQAWPGLLPPRNPSDESVNAISSTCSTESRRTIKHDFIFPGRPPQSHQCVGHCCEKRRRSKKHRKRKHRRKHKCHRRHRRKHRRKKNACMCEKCGNVHRRKKKKREKVKCDDICDNKTPENVNKPMSQLHFPFLSFLRHFCKNKPHSSRKSKSRHSIMKKISTVHLLKYSRKKPKKSKKHCQKTHTTSNASEVSCNCITKLNEIKDRLEHLEQMQNTRDDDHHSKRRKKKDPECDHSEEIEKCERHEKKRKKKKHLDCSECLKTCCPDDPEHEKKRKKKKRKRKKDCCCSDNSSKCEHQDEVQTYYCTYPASVKTNVTPETNESVTTKTTTTTTTTTATTATTEGTESSTLSKTEDNPPRRDGGLKGRLSSLQSLLNNFQRHRKPRSQANNSTNIFVVREPGPIDDSSKGSPMPRGRISHELKTEESSFMKKFKKLKRKESKNKNGDKKEKAKVVKEKRSPEPKSRGRRHG